MKTLYFILSLSLTQLCFAASLSDKEAEEMKREINSMLALFENGDVTGLINKTHESIYTVTGGKENFESITKNAVEQLMQADVKFLGSELGKPTEIYPAGEYEVCFVPRISIMEIQGQKARSTGFMIAARTKGGSEWKYLDGSGLRNNPHLLAMLFPDLDPDIQLPPNKAERL